MFRKKLSRSGSRKMFTKGATRMHPKNSLRSFLMRGGIRL